MQIQSLTLATPPLMAGWNNFSTASMPPSASSAPASNLAAQTNLGQNDDATDDSASSQNMRAKILDRLGYSEGDLNKMSFDQRQMIDAKVAQEIQYLSAAGLHHMVGARLDIRV